MDRSIKELDDDNSFFDFEIDTSMVERTNGVYIFNSSNDYDVIHSSVKNIVAKLPDVHLIQLENKGHFTLSGMGTREFPELAKILLN